MENITVFETDGLQGKTEHVIIDKGNNEFVYMPKAVWDELEAQREQSGTL